MTAASGRRDGARAVVPVEATEEMVEAFYIGAHAAKEAAFSVQKFPYGIAPAEWFPQGWAALIAASPSAGSISAEDLERAAEAAYRKSEAQALKTGYRVKPWERVNAGIKALLVEQQRAAFEADGLTVAPDGEK